MRCNKCGKDLSTIDHYEGDMSRVEYISDTKSFVVIDTIHINLCDDCYFLNSEQEFPGDGEENNNGEALDSGISAERGYESADGSESGREE